MSERETLIREQVADARAKQRYEVPPFWHIGDVECLLNEIDRLRAASRGPVAPPSEPSPEAITSLHRALNNDFSGFGQEVSRGYASDLARQLYALFLRDFPLGGRQPDPAPRIIKSERPPLILDDAESGGVTPAEEPTK